MWSYRQLYLPTVESSEVSDREYARYQRESEYAWAALHAAFGHEVGFTTEFLRDMSNGSSDRIATRTSQWIHGITWPEGAQGGVWESTADTAEECCEKTKVFMQNRLWPFTKVIR